MSLMVSHRPNLLAITMGCMEIPQTEMGFGLTPGPKTLTTARFLDPARVFISKYFAEFY
jgi:hypothetical protein